MIQQCLGRRANHAMYNTKFLLYQPREHTTLLTLQTSSKLTTMKKQWKMYFIHPQAIITNGDCYTALVDVFFW